MITCCHGRSSRRWRWRCWTRKLDSATCLTLLDQIQPAVASRSPQQTWILHQDVPFLCLMLFLRPPSTLKMTLSLSSFKLTCKISIIPNHKISQSNPHSIQVWSNYEKTFQTDCFHLQVYTSNHHLGHQPVHKDASVTITSCLSHIAFSKNLSILYGQLGMFAELLVLFVSYSITCYVPIWLTLCTFSCLSPFRSMYVPKLPIKFDLQFLFLTDFNAKWYSCYNNICLEYIHFI